MYYGLIILSVFMFGGCFALKDVYRKKRGSGLKISLQFSLVTSTAAFIMFLVANGFKLEFTLFTFILSMVGVLVGVGSTFCGFKALGIANLSVYSLFMMLGGMVLPFLQGIIFYGEDITVAKVVCFVFICIALALTVERGEKKKKGGIFYAAIFVFNGMSGVLSKIFTASEYPKTSAAGYSILKSLCMIVVCIILLLIFFRKKGDVPPMRFADVGIAALYGGVNRLANYILVIALAFVDSSVQYPMVTGGVMIVSTLISLFGPNKPSKKEILSVLIAFVGMLALFLIPV